MVRTLNINENMLTPETPGVDASVDLGSCDARVWFRATVREAVL